MIRWYWRLVTGAPSERPHNPGGWPTGPLEHGIYYDRRDVCNAGADLRDAIFNEVRPLVEWINDRLERIGS